MNETQSTDEGSCTESGTWIIYDCKLLNLEEPRVEDPNLENLEVENYTSNAPDILGNPFPCQPVDPDASMERDTWMDQNNKEVVAQLVSTIDTDNVMHTHTRVCVLEKGISHGPQHLSC